LRLCLCRLSVSGNSSAQKSGRCERDMTLHGAFPFAKGE
jgi:hypothetical protein